jgi:GT2 family glycosyltransferase
VDRIGAPIPVYVVHWNAPAWLRATVDSFLGSSIAVAVTVIDNGPYDVPLDLDPRVSVVRTGANLGYAGGANVGIDAWLAGESDVCVIACHDVTLETDGLHQLVSTARAVDEYGIVAPRPGANVAAAPWFGRGDVITPAAWASGTCLLLQRACIEQIGGFDESFGSYGEDIDLCMRARDAGWKVGIVMEVFARGQGSVNPSFRTQMYVNQIRLRRKRAGRAQAAKMLIAFPLLAGRDTVRWIFTRDPALLRHARGRLSATPAGARLLWQQRRDPIAS